MITLFERPRGAPRLIVAGLGNPGDKYFGTRHNLGFMVLDRLLEKAGGDGFSPDRRRRAHTARTVVGGLDSLLVKPQDFVNRSGGPVSAVAAFYRLPASRVLVVCDDMALAFGRTRLRPGGSSGGHNGLQSIIEAIGRDFPRLRVGIGAPPDPSGWSSFVLSRFRPEEAGELPALLDRVADEVIAFAGSLETGPG